MLGNILGLRNGDGWFSVEDLERLFVNLRIPAPKSFVRSLGQLRNDEVMLCRGAERPWALTPQGRQQAAALAGDLSLQQIEVEVELAGTPGVDYAHARHLVIPPAFAPLRWQAGIARLLAETPFETNVFCMTRFPRRNVRKNRGFYAR